MIFSTFNIVLGILPIIFYLTGMKLKEKGIESWLLRKYYHILLHTLLGIYAMIHENIIDLLITLLIFVFLSFLFSLTPYFSMKSIFESGKRDDESIYSLLINNNLTLLTSVLLLVFTTTWVFALASLVVGLGDGFGEVIGKPFGRMKYKIFEKKTIEGSIAVLLGSFASIIIVNNFYTLDFSIVLIFLFSVFLMLVEGFSFSFLDNILLQIAILYLYFI